MLWNRKDRPSGGTWRCAAKHRQHSQRWFAEMSGPAYSLRQLKNRRANALLRRRKRKEQHG